MTLSQARACRVMRVAELTAIVILAAGISLARTGTTANNNVTSTVFDTDSNGASVLLQSDDTAGPGSATYATSSATGVVSQIAGYALYDWDLSLQNSSRGFYLTLQTTTGSWIPGLPTGPYFYSGRLISRCFDPTGATTNTF